MRRTTAKRNSVDSGEEIESSIVKHGEPPGQAPRTPSPGNEASGKLDFGSFDRT